MSTSTPHTPTYYEILNLSQSTVSSSDDSNTLIKRAYRRALLSHHPDKSKTHNTKRLDPRRSFTIDQISTAYATLSRPSQRAAYDLSLTLSQSQQAQAQGQRQANFQTGIETVDLDDLDYEEEPASGETRWYRSCRCGNPRGYLFSEADLEDAEDLGELMVGCADCSLWLRVHFAVVDDDGDEGEGAIGSGSGEVGKDGR